MKPLKRSVSLVIEGPAGVLLVRRPDDDDSLPGLWGLPAASLRQYVEWRWGDPAELAPAARAGSVCVRVLLRSVGSGW